MNKKTLRPLVIGIDEVGRGAIAGPLVAAAVWLPEDSGFHAFFEGKDSKMLTAKKRLQLKEVIVANGVWSIAEASVAEIFELGITDANKLAIKRAAENIPVNFTVALVDGNMNFEDKRFTSIIAGDKNVACICAASILAKIYRDDLMKELCSQMPSYGFSKHKGYGTANHLQAIKQHGPLKEYHRLGFKNFSNIANY